MEEVISPRHFGKTYRLIKFSAEKGGIIVCRTKEDADRIQKSSKNFGFKIPAPLVIN